MSNKLIDQLDDYFKNSQNLTMEEMEKFVHETLRFFDTLRSTMLNGTEEEKKQAMQDAQEMQTKLQDLAKKAYDKVGMNPEEVTKFLAEGHFPKEQMKHFNNAQEEITEYKKSIGNEKPKNLK